MKMEFSIEGKVVIIEAEGCVSVHIREMCSPEVTPVAVPEASAREAAVSDGLFSRLCELRRALAHEQGVPPYVVFKDSTLREMAQALPASLEELGRISGVGAAKLQKYGAAFLAALQGDSVPGDAA